MNQELDRRHVNVTDNEHVTLTTMQARQGATPHVTRYVLSWGLALVTFAFILVYWLLAIISSAALLGGHAFAGRPGDFPLLVFINGTLVSLQPPH